MIPIKPVSAITASVAVALNPNVAQKFLQPGSLNLAALPPLSLYIHFPWCVKKCPYCDFNSHEVRGGFPEDAYLDALRLDLERALPAIWGRPAWIRSMTRILRLPRCWRKPSPCFASSALSANVFR